LNTKSLIEAKSYLDMPVSAILHYNSSVSLWYLEFPYE